MKGGGDVGVTKVCTTIEGEVKVCYSKNFVYEGHLNLSEGGRTLQPLQRTPVKNFLLGKKCGRGKYIVVVICYCCIEKVELRKGGSKCPDTRSALH